MPNGGGRLSFFKHIQEFYTDTVHIKNLSGKCLFLCFLIFLFGCATDNTPKPNPVPKIDNSVNVSIVWDVGSLSNSSPGSFVPVIDADNAIFTADSSGRIYKFDSSDGTKIFSFKLDKKLTSGTAINSDTIFVTTADSYLLAIGKANHQIKWKAKLPTLSIEAPQSTNNIVIVRTNDATLLAYNTENGSLLWVVQQPIPTLTLRSTNTFQIAPSEDILVTGGPNGRLSVINLLNGMTIWSTFIAVPSGATDFDKLIDIDMRPVLNSDRIICVGSYNGNITCLDAISSNTIWSNKFSTSTQILTDEQNVYAIGQDGVVYAFDRHSGKTIWKSNILQYRVLGSPAFINNYIATVEIDGYINLFDKGTGALVSRISSNLYDGTSYPISNGSAVIMQSANGHLAKFIIK